MPLEAQLILHCAAALNREDSRRSAITATIQRGVDWEVVTRVAAFQGVLPSVYRALIPAFASELPVSVRERLRQDVHGNALRNRYLAAEMVRLSRLLEKHGVRMLALKGPALAAGVYGDVTLRQFSDLDLLVHERDLGAAFAVLAGDGFRTKAPFKLSSNKPPSGWEMSFEREQGLFEVDLHWRLCPAYFPFTWEGDQLWTRAVEVDLGPGRVSALGPEDLMLFLCAHGAKHGWQALSGLCDVTQASRAYQYDWEGLAARANSLGSLRIVSLGVLLAHDLLGAMIPSRFIDAARAEPSVEHAARSFCRYFYQLGTTAPGLLQRWAIPLAMIPNRSSQVRYTLARAFQPAVRDFDFVSLPLALSRLYYPLRPLRLALQKVSSFSRL